MRHLTILKMVVVHVCFVLLLFFNSVSIMFLPLILQAYGIAR